MSETNPNQLESGRVLAEIGFDILVDALTYGTSQNYRYQQAIELAATNAQDEEQLLLIEYLRHPAPAGEAALASLKFWRMDQGSAVPLSEEYARYQADLTDYLEATDYSDEPEHDLTKQKLLAGPLLTPREFERLQRRAGRRVGTSQVLGRAIIHRLMRRG